MSRRTLSLWIILSSLAVFPGGVFSNPVFAEPPVPVDPDRVVLLSDVHIADPTVGEPADSDPGREDRTKEMPVRHLKEAVSKIVAMRPRPAVVLVTGDSAFKRGCESDYTMLRRLIAPLAEANIPVYFMMGNHDIREAFYKVFPERKPAKPLVDGKHVQIVSTPKADWIMLDSKTRVDYVQGRLEEKQLAWLKSQLKRQKKPTIVLTHHNPNSETENNGLEDAEAFYAVIDPAPVVKAYIFGHSHFWNRSRRESGLQLVNLPGTVWTFVENAPRGFVDAKLDDRGMTMTFHSVGEDTSLDGKEYRVDWR